MVALFFNPLSHPSCCLLSFLIPATTRRSRLTVHGSRFTVHHLCSNHVPHFLPFTTYHLRFTFALHDSRFTVYHHRFIPDPFHGSRFTVHHLRLILAPHFLLPTALFSSFHVFFISSEISFVSDNTGMKFVSPLQRGTMWKCTCSSIPAPAARPRFTPKL